MPRPLIAILAAVAIQALAWTFMVPALQGADEGGHVAYVQRVADGHEIPWRWGPSISGSYSATVSTEQRLAWVWAGLEPLRGNLSARPLWTEVDERLWRDRTLRLTVAQRADGGENPSFRNPPAYYVLASAPYKLAGGTFVDRVWAMRLANIPLLLLVVWLTWLIAGEVFGRRRGLQAVAAIVVGTQPVLLDVSTRVTPDVLLNALGALVLYLLALVARRGAQPILVISLLAATAAASLTHGRALGLVPPVLLVLAWAVWTSGGARRLPAAVGAGVGALVLFGYDLFAGRWSLDHLAGFPSYLWQFYLPALPGMSPVPGPTWGAEQLYLERLFATFVQFEVRFPEVLQSAVRAALWAGLLAVLVAAWRHRGALRERRHVLLVLLGAAALEILALHAAAFRSLVVDPIDPVITGRYLLVAAPMIGLAVAGALTSFPLRFRATAAGAVVAGAFLLQLAAFGLILERFHA